MVEQDGKTERVMKVVALAACAAWVAALPASLSANHEMGARGAANLTAEQPADVVEKGKFVLHKFEQPIGEETYQISRDGDSVVVKVDFKFTDRGTAVPLKVRKGSASE